MAEENPYAHASSRSKKSSGKPRIYPDASNVKRFAHYLLDNVFFNSFALALMTLVNISSTNNEDLLGDTSHAAANVILIVLYLGYYLFFEGMYGFTPAKLITGCRVVHADTYKKVGIKPIVIRTMCRFIPFENFSFFRRRPGGWHDHFSKTRVIDKRK